jgi:hypothetical protein
MKIPPGVPELLYADRRTDTHANLIDVFLQVFLAKASENEKKKSIWLQDSDKN